MNCISEALKFYRRNCHKALEESVKRAAQAPFRSSIYSASVTIWLMMFQRMNGDHSLSAAVEELRRGNLKELLDLNSLRASSGKISNSTGAYSKARERLELEVLEEAVDALNAAVISSHRKHEHKGRRVFIVDGSTLRIPHTKRNISAYSRYENQHGKAHYPLVRFSVMTDAVTGVALRPVYGPYVGGKATDEISLFEKLLPQVPANSIIIGDRYYGCARVACEAEEQGHDVICRVKEGVAKHLIGGLPGTSGEKETTWETERSRSGNDFYSVEGRLIWHTLRRKGFRPKLLVLFTTLPYSRKDIVELYGLRWNVELDLRQLKSTLDMNMLTAKSPDIVAKELVAGMAAYNLIRHVMFVSAKFLKVKPRQISFTKTLRRIRSIHSTVLESGLTPNTQRVFDYLLNDVKSLKLATQNKKCNAEPRKVWPKGEKNTMTNSRQAQRRALKNTPREFK